MNPFNVLCSFLVSLTITAYIVIAIDSPSRSSSCPPDQRDALLQLKNSFSITGPPPIYSYDDCMNTSYPKTASWREDKDCCSWEGVVCDNSTGEIVGLDLSCARIRGAIDSNSSLFSLRHLRSISLAGNDLIGSSIPPEISVFSRMTYLNLSLSNVSGNVPTEISQLSKLVSLDLSSNGLEVQNPTMRMLVKNLTQLEDLDLTWVNMSAVIPTSLMNFSSSLITLQLSRCSLGGKFPDYIFQLPNLLQLDLSMNSDLHGTLPESNWSSSLAFLDLFQNNFTGHVDLRTFSTLKNLRYLRLSGVSISGEDATDANHTFPKLESLDILYGMLNNFPCFLSSMPELRELDLSDSIVSEFPGQCANNGLSFPQLQSMYMLFCNLTKFPSFLSQSNKLRVLYLVGNRIEEIPSWFWGIGIDTLEELNLGDNLLRGGLRLPWKRLTSLEVENNSFEGPLPIPTSRSISKFSLSQNRFNGSIPLSICQLTHLHVLTLSQNNLTGVIPECLSNLTDLGCLDLSSNNLTGVIPECLSNLTDLWYLNLSSSSLTGTLPPCLGNLSHLLFLDLSSSSLTGPLPPCLGNLSHLLSLDLSKNSLTGPLPPWFGNRSHLRYLQLSKNSLTGPLPPCLGNFSNLRALDLSNNSLTGPLPPCLGNLSDLYYLDLSKNSLTGPLPPCLGYLSDLLYLDLRKNLLTGPLPLPSYALKYYLVSNNNFSGEISSLLCNATNLLSLDLSNNGLTGTLPQCLKNVTIQLHFLNLRANRFQGSIPEIFSEGCGLTSIDFSRNQFGGSLPRSLSNCSKLQVLAVGNNKIVDSFPDWLGDLPLKILSLRSNKFYGPVSISKGTHPMSTIRVLDLSNNSFEGNLPDNLIDEMFNMSLGSNAGYMVGSDSPVWAFVVSELFFSVRIDLKGVETEMEKIFTQFATLDLSCNHFGGEIPRNIGLLKFLKGLNFSHNCFAGTIPPSVGNLTNLESFDLSSNYLVGGIPSELVQLTSLEALYLSRNNLTGPIPLGGQFNTFANSSFDGNPGLCGIPLTRACSQGHAESQPPQNRGDNGEDEAGRWLEWKFVVMGFGSGLAIGISLGYMALEIGKPLWLARMVIRLETSCKIGSKRKYPRRICRR